MNKEEDLAKEILEGLDELYLKDEICSHCGHKTTYNNK